MLKPMRDWRAPAEWQKITSIDLHTAGEPFRVITGGWPMPSGDTILARRQEMMDHWDHLRTALMWEPRGHADMYGGVLTPAVTSEADFGVLFLHNDGYSSMCGHGIIAVATVALETGLVPLQHPETTLKIDTPAGLITAHARTVDGRVVAVRFENVPSFVVELDATVAVPGYGTVTYDLAYGGAFYAYVDAAAVGLSTAPSDVDGLISAGKAIKAAVIAAREIHHPFEEALSFLYGTIFVGPPHDSTDGRPAAHSSNVCIFAEGEVDRSPTGTGVSGRLAIHHRRGELDANAPIVIDSILGTRFTGRVLGETTYGPYSAILPEVTGQAFITGRHEFLIDPADPLKRGFIFR
ncbi:MAG: proline racemase family protein [Desulfosarcinaceae bacterium]|nr:proline racemase family protein [Desulfosarcinaceae bacterium]